MIYLGTFTSTKVALLDLAQDYLSQDKRLAGIQLGIKDQVFTLSYQMMVLGQKIPLPVTLTFLPSLPNDQTLVLTLETFSESLFSWSREKVIEHFTKTIRLPDFVSLDNRAASLTVHLDKLASKQGVVLRLTAFDLGADQIICEVFKV